MCNCKFNFLYFLKCVPITFELTDLILDEDATIEDATKSRSKQQNN